MVSQRRSLLDHLKKSDDARYTALIENPWPAPIARRKPLGSRLGREMRPDNLICRAPPKTGWRASGVIRAVRRADHPYAEGCNLESSSACRWRGLPDRREKAVSAPSVPEGMGLRDLKERQFMFDIKRKSIEWGGRKLTLETGRIARQADGAVLATYGETMVLATAVFAKSAEARPGFLPADRELPGEDLRRRQDPRRLLPARGRALAEGDPDLAPDRPSDPPAVRQGLQERGPGRRRPCSPTTSRTIPTSSPWSPPRPPWCCPARPFMGPIGAARVGFIDGEYVLNPTLDELKTVEDGPGRRRHRRRGDDGRIRDPGAVRRRRCWAASCSPTRACSR